MDPKSIALGAVLAGALGLAAGTQISKKTFAEMSKTVDDTRAADAKAKALAESTGVRCNVRPVMDGDKISFEQAVCGELALDKDQSAECLKARWLDGSCTLTREMARGIDIDYDKAAEQGALVKGDAKPAEGPAEGLGEKVGP